MFKKIAEFFTGKKPEVAPVAESAPYKVPEPAATTPIPLIPDAVVVVPEAVVPSAVVEQAQAAATPKKPRAPAKSKAVKAVVAKAPVALKKPRAPKAK